MRLELLESGVTRFSCLLLKGDLPSILEEDMRVTLISSQTRVNVKKEEFLKKKVSSNARMESVELSQV